MADFNNTRINSTGFIKIPNGSESQRPASPAPGMIRLNTDSNNVELYNGERWVAGGSTMAASGGTVTDITDNGIPYRVHTFSSDGSFEVTSAGDAEVLIVAGGGGGGGDNSGGGGAGGLVYFGPESPAVDNGVAFQPGTYNITVGQGGGGAPAVNTLANNGENSSISGSTVDLTAIGGGRGGTGNGGQHDGAAGGSGGGGASEGTNGTGGNGQQPSQSTGGFGNNGGNSSGGAGGGGGGAATNGQNGQARGTDLGGDGGQGFSYSISGSTQFYAAGGNAGNENGNFNSRPAVNGIGGRTNSSGSTGTIPAVNGTGSGGGGVTHVTNDNIEGEYGSSGGSGIVIIRYKT